MSEDLYVGYENIITGESLNIGKIPGRKGYCLYTSYGNQYCMQFVPLAYFRKEKQAEMAIGLLKAIANAPKVHNA